MAFFDWGYICFESIGVYCDTLWCYERMGVIPLVTRNSCGDRAEYSKQFLRFLSDQLTAEFGTSFTVRNLRFMRQFNQTFPIRNV